MERASPTIAMLAHLRIRGLALLDDVVLELAPGMNVLTGETGAGKSIIVDALSLLRGERARSDMIRAGAGEAKVSALFELGEATRQRIANALDEHGISFDHGDGLVVERTISGVGRGRSFVQGCPTTQAILAKLGELLVDICSQHEHHFLTHVAKHLDVLDAYAKLERDVIEYDSCYQQWRAALADMRAIQANAHDALRRMDYLRFQIDELERVAPEPGEYDGLRQRITLMRDVHRWVEFAREAHEILYEADDAVSGRIASLLERVRKGVDGSHVLAHMQEQLTLAQTACEEAAALAARFAQELTFEPSELEHAEERLHALESLKRKHGIEPDALHDRMQDMRRELASLEQADERAMQAGQETERLEIRCRTIAQRLHAPRVAAAEQLARAIEQELAALHMQKTRFEVCVRSSHEFGPRGCDDVEFLLSANPGEAVAPLSRVASGGELSRVLLAVKGVLATGDTVTTYVFDEVDAGVGGAVAESIGRRLHQAATNHQVLCITHLPQIAAFADAHFRVDKATKAGRTSTRVVRLDENERLEELARMLGGARVTESAREHARQLSTDARALLRQGKNSRRQKV